MSSKKYTGPTRFTYEEWYAYNQQRLTAGKGPSAIRYTRYCLRCSKSISDSEVFDRHEKPHRCTESPDFDWFRDTCEKASIRSR